MKVVTSGLKYLDIDAYAGCIAYAELLRLTGVDAIAFSSAAINESITQTIRLWAVEFSSDYEIGSNDTFILIDVSEPEYIEKNVNIDRVEEVIDHHPGLEKYWQQRLGDKSHIEFIGAACTLVYERWNAANLLDKMSVLSARLLICGILDNTLNFGAAITTRRDIDAYDTLLTKAKLPDDWTAQYFTECQEAILQDIAAAIQNDTKILSFKSFEQPICFGQLVVWEEKQVLTGHQDVLKEVLSNMKPDWLMNLVDISESKSYFVTENTHVQAWLSELLSVRFDGSVAIADRLWLRKEVIQQDITNS